MTRMWKNTIRAFCALATIAVMAFGTSQAFAAMPGGCVDPKNGVIGECPPYNNQTCAEDCDKIFGLGFGGQCHHGCCYCYL